MSDLLNSRSSRFWLAAVVVCGLLLQTWLFVRSWLSGDQLVLLQLGLDFVSTHDLKAVAKGMSGSGHLPGGLLQLVIGVPLLIYPHFKSPNVVVFLSHIAALWIFIRVLRPSVSPIFLVIFAGLYWLSPWRLYHAGFLWEPSLLYLPAAAHLWACWRSRDTRAIVPSFILGLLMTATLQLHASFLILVVLTVLLWVGRRIRVHLLAAGAGLIVGGLTLIPTIIAWYQGTLPGVNPSDGFVGRGLVYVFPLLKGVLYWIRFISSDAGSTIKTTMFMRGEWGDGSACRAIVSAVVYGLFYAGTASILLCVPAVYRFVRDHLTHWNKRVHEPMAWLMQYALYALGAMLVAVALSPVTTQSWHVILILPAACLSASYWFEQQWMNGRALMRYAIIALIVIRIPLTITFGLGHDRYRKRPLSEFVDEANISPELRELIPRVPAEKEE
ncbi:MAG: hypothetical protein GF341_10090 [candidate division Zixibacteria bacterium]|nr:hypothetical protein [candidate division Zixibacteria bacterium]